MKIGEWLELHPELITLHSGQQSMWRINCEKFYDDEHVREEILRFWLNSIRLWRPPYKIEGIPRGGLIWANALNERLGMENKKAPSQAPISFIVDDVVTTGSSIFDIPSVHAHLAVADRRPPGLALRQPHLSAWMTLHLDN